MFLHGQDNSVQSFASLALKCVDKLSFNFIPFVWLSGSEWKGQNQYCFLVCFLTQMNVTSSVLSLY